MLDKPQQTVLNFPSTRFTMIEREVKLETPLTCPRCGRNAHTYSRGEFYFAECFPCLLRTAPTKDLPSINLRWNELVTPALTETLLKSHRKLEKTLATLKQKYS